ncbi:MAG: hypothetical protein GX605_12065, partial [Chloroflexi bacterium]|nr:hypothetical protein [Chloroflexota bacterium]
DAIAEYSHHLPRLVESAANPCAAGDRTYALPSGCLAVLLVEYPEGEDTPVYLDYLDPTDPRFGPGTYYVQGSTLVLGAEPEAGQTYGLVYHAPHDYPDGDETALTVPDEDLECLVEYVIWKAYRMLEMQEAINPNAATVVLSMLNTSAARAQRAWQEAVQRRAGKARGQTAPWG